MDENERKQQDKGRAQHGYRNEVSWEGGAGRQPYTNQEAEIGPATAKEFEGGNTGDVCSAAIPSLRAPLGIRVMRAGKDYLSDKAAVTTLDQLAEVRRTIKQTEELRQKPEPPEREAPRDTR